ncbi:hypothetical protein Acid345_2537 [Candidatus Koribacter versatilis Ellin345]|uniref:Uncharacterized protein n=1 Tax=Koribacter versatilis (strain Ellin345) TaxID=204669 RepID=Q1INL2_KORVE|nr:hypothetical protein [Candidatus Koribacter versatilis]ABF41538.1 hypothetical protein Acid345_2537 [Candidatus Koribacter versatilis Ellin345]
MIELSEQTAELVWRLFEKSDWHEAALLLENECSDNLPLVRQWGPTPASMERLRFATLKLSDGKIEKLHTALDLAKKNWRDLLMAAGFGHRLDAHKRWAENLLSVKRRAC